MSETKQKQKTKAQLYLCGAALLLVTLACLYVYFLSVSVVEVVARKQVDTEITNLYSEISELESTYIERQHAVSEELAMQYGFEKTSKKTFVDSTDSGLAMTDTHTLR